jgi:hypothetical protein
VSLVEVVILVGLGAALAFVVLRSRDQTGPTADHRPDVKDTETTAPARVATPRPPRVRSRGGGRSVAMLVVAVLIFGSIGWYAYAHQTDQQIICEVYKAAGRTPEFPRVVTCFFNGNL